MPLSFRRFFSMIILSIAFASSYSFFASAPTVSSLKIFGYPRFGYRPRSCHTWKKGFQSM